MTSRETKLYALGSTIIGSGKAIYYTALGGTATAGAFKWFAGQPLKKAFTPFARVVDFGARVTWRQAAALASTQLVRGKSLTVGGAGLALAAGALAGGALGAAGGIFISEKAFGHSGREKAMDLYLPGGASLPDAVLSIPSNARYIARHYL